MDVLTALGLQFRIQRFISIPNFRLSGETWMNLVARIIPFGIIIIIGFFDVVDMFSYRKDFVKITSVPLLVTRFEQTAQKTGVVFIAILSLVIHRKHMNVLKVIVEYDEMFRRYQERYIKNPIELPTSRRSNVEFFLVFTVNAILVLNLHLMTSLDGPPKKILFHIFYTLLMSIHDYVLIYIANIIRIFSCHEVQLEQILQDDASRQNQEVFSLIKGFSGILSMINKTFGCLTFYEFIHHLFGSCMQTYLLFWLIFVGPHFSTIIPFVLSSASYNIRTISFIIHISIIGESIPIKIEKLRRLICRWMKDEDMCATRENWVAGSRIEDNDENLMRAVKFNTHQLLMRYLQEKTQITASQYFSINNSAIYATFGAVITYLMVLIQFQELDHALTAQE